MLFAYFCVSCLVCWQAARFQIVSGAKSVPVTKEIIDILDNTELYDKQATPNQNDGYPTNLSISMYIEGISSFRAQTMDFHLDMYFQQRWSDRRLMHNESRRILIRDLEILNKMWHPDVYFANARVAQFHTVTQPNFLLWLQPDGSIMYDTRISLSVMCMMHLAKWPLDSQNCSLRILSYAYDTDQLRINWDAVDPISRNVEIKMPDMHLLGVVPGKCDGNFPTGVWSCVTARFLVKREIMHHITQSYVPTALIVVISWFSFWLDVDAVPARVSLSITTLLTLSTQATAARMALPEVSYMKAIDVWMGMCMAFVFGVMIEFTVANYAQRQGEKAALRKDRSEAIEKEKAGGSPLPGGAGGSAGTGTGGGRLKKSVTKRLVGHANEWLTPAEETKEREQRALDLLRRVIRNKVRRSNNTCSPHVKFESETELESPRYQIANRTTSSSNMIYHQLPTHTSITPSPPTKRSLVALNRSSQHSSSNCLDASPRLSPLTSPRSDSLRSILHTNAIDSGGSQMSPRVAARVAESHGVLRSSLLAQKKGRVREPPKTLSFYDNLNVQSAASPSDSILDVVGLRRTAFKRPVCFSSSAERLAQWSVPGRIDGGAQPTLQSSHHRPHPQPANNVGASANALGSIPPPTTSTTLIGGAGGGWAKLKSALGSDGDGCEGGGATSSGNHASSSSIRRDVSAPTPTVRPHLRRKSIGPDKWMAIIRQANNNKKLFGRRAAKRIDHHARWSFPFCFFVLNIIYWYYYLYVAKNVD